MPANGRTRSIPTALMLAPLGATMGMALALAVGSARPVNAGTSKARAAWPGQQQGAVQSDSSAPGAGVHLVLLGTTDLHGRIEPLDYWTNKPANLGLAKIANLVQQVRAREPHVLLFDSGDVIQGTPLAYYFARKDTARPNPMMLAMECAGLRRDGRGQSRIQLRPERAFEGEEGSALPYPGSERSVRM